MDLSRADTAVVIAAGAGARLRRTSANAGLLKPATPVLGVPIVVRTLATLRDQGVRRAVVVTGYRGWELAALVAADTRLEGLRLEFAHNPHWPLQNGLSVLAARATVGGGPFFLSMADHLYAGEVVNALRRSFPADADLALAVDRRADAVLDPDDAVRVRVDAGGLITAIGKRLAAFDAIDTGVFLCTSALFATLHSACARYGDCSLSDGVRLLAEKRRARAVDIPATAWWQDVDTADDLRAAEEKVGAAAALASAAV